MAVTPQWIAQRARALGLDADAVLRVFSAEGLSGGIGDGGHAFGAQKRLLTFSIGKPRFFKSRITRSRKQAHRRQVRNPCLVLYVFSGVNSWPRLQCVLVAACSWIPRRMFSRGVTGSMCSGFTQ